MWNSRILNFEQQLTMFFYQNLGLVNKYTPTLAFIMSEFRSLDWISVFLLNWLSNFDSIWVYGWLV